jgi:hypothetical protein
LFLSVLYIRTLEQSYCVISAFDLERIDEMLIRAINLCGSPRSLSELDLNADATASYAGAYGYSYQTLKSIKDHIDTARPFDPSLAWDPF